MNNKRFLRILKKGFCPWQTMPFYNANLFGTPEKGIFLVISQDYPSFGDGDGNKVTHCDPKDFDMVMPVIKEIFETENSSLFEKVEEYFKEVKDIEDSFVLPNGESVVRGDYIEITWQPHYVNNPISRIMIVGLIENENLFEDVDQHYVNRKDIKSARKVTGLIAFRERPAGDADKLRKNHNYESTQIFGRSFRPDTIRTYDILIEKEPTGYVQFDSIKDNYKESHIVDEKHICKEREEQTMAFA